MQEQMKKAIADLNHRAANATEEGHSWNYDDLRLVRAVDHATRKVFERIVELETRNEQLVETFLDLVIEKMGLEWFRAYVEKRRANKP